MIRRRPLVLRCPSSAIVTAAITLVVCLGDVCDAADFLTRHYSMVVPRPKTDADEHYRQALHLADTGRYPEAITECRKAIAADPSRLRYNDQLAHCLKGERRYNEAIEACELSLFWDPLDAYPYREFGIACYDRNEKGDKERALAAFEQCVTWDSSDSSGFIWLGYCLDSLRRYHEAALAFERAAKLKPRDFDAHYRQGISLFRAQKFDEASKPLGEAVRLRPKDFEANYWLGVSELRVRRFASAIPNLEAAHRIKPDDRRPGMMLVSCYLATRQIRKAAALYPVASAGIAFAFAAVYLIG